MNEWGDFSCGAIERKRLGWKALYFILYTITGNTLDADNEQERKSREKYYTHTHTFGVKRSPMIA